MSGAVIMKLCLASKDGEMFTADRGNMKLNQLVKEMCEDNEDEELVIPLPNVSSKDLKKVIEFCDYFHIILSLL